MLKTGLPPAPATTIHRVSLVVPPGMASHCSVKAARGLSDWAAAKFGASTASGLVRWLLIRRHIQTGERAYYLCAAPPDATAKDLAIAAGKRWAIETCFESAKQETGLDEYEVRSWDGWYRHITLSLLAAAFLTAVRLQASEAKPARSKTRRNSSR